MDSSLPHLPKTQKVFIIAGEASGDIIGSKILEALSHTHPCTFHGIGGELMLESGLNESLFPMQELSLMGLVEVIPHLPRILKRMRQTLDYVQALKPDIVITIDSPGFNFNIAKRIKKLNLGIPLVHVVAPTVWAWKPKRAEKIAAIYDHLFCLFPFEPPYFTVHGLATTFIGHPVTTLPNGSDAPTSNTVLMLPGSRKSEIAKHFEIFATTLNESAYEKVTIATLGHLEKMIQPLAAQYLTKPYTIVTRNTYAHFISARSALAASGTVSLELAKAKTPAVIAYRLSPLTYWVAKKLVKTPFVSLVNILMKRDVTPECLQENCNVEQLTKALQDIESERPAILTGYEAALKKIKFRPDIIAPILLKLMGTKPIRFYGRRKGKNATDHEKINPYLMAKDYDWHLNQDTFLEIGFGGGEHLAQVAQRSPESRFIGCEVFEPGVQSLCTYLHEHHTTNVSVYNQDARFLLHDIPPHSLDGIYILFADPWPKKRHHNRRIIQETNLRQLYKLLKPGGFIKIASDHEGYQKWIAHEITKVADIFKQVRDDVTLRPCTKEWPQTRYELKGLAKGDHSHFFELRKYADSAPKHH